MDQGAFRFFSGYEAGRVQVFPDFNRDGFNTEFGYVAGPMAEPSAPESGKIALQPHPRRNLPMTLKQQRRLRTPTVQSPLETYLSEINETPLLSAEEEK